MTDFAQRFELLRQNWASLRQRQVDGERSAAPRHNLIRFLSLHRAEVGFHSPFLRDLLDPYGSHGQGPLFLKNFLEMVGNKARYCGIKWTYRWVGTEIMDCGEWIVLGEHGKIDISIRNRAQRVLIFLENKIDAGEQDNQLTRYLERLEQEQHLYDHRLLLFLSPRGYEPTTGRPHLRITYEDDIAPWIADAMPQVPASAVGLYGNLHQYHSVVRFIQSEGDRTMPNHELVDLIGKRENLECAWDILDSMRGVENALCLRFWQNVEASCLRSLTEMDLEGSWSVSGIKDIEKDPRGDYRGISVARLGTQRQPYLNLTIYVERGKVYGGVSFTAQQPHPHPSELIQALRAVLPAWWQGPNDWWIGYYDTGYRMPSRELLLDVATDVISVVQPMADAIMAILKDHVVALIAADDALWAAA
jgi:hypothetical protein